MLAGEISPKGLCARNGLFGSFMTTKQEDSIKRWGRKDNSHKLVNYQFLLHILNTSFYSSEQVLEKRE